MQHNYTGSHLLPAWLALREGRRGHQHPLVRFDAVLPSTLRNRLRRRFPEWLTDRLVRHKFPANGEVYLLPGSEYGALLRVNLEGREPRGVVNNFRFSFLVLVLVLVLLQDQETVHSMLASGKWGGYS